MKPEKVVGVFAWVLLFCTAGLMSSLLPWPAKLREPWSAGDWAAWVQAVGSIAAIVAAIVISQYQSYQRKCEARGTATLFCMHLVEAAVRARKLVAAGNFTLLEVEAASIDELIQMARSVPAGALAPSQSWKYTRVLARAVALRTICAAALQASKSGSVQPVGMLNAFDAAPKEIVKTIGKLPDELDEDPSRSAYWRLLEHHKLKVPEANI